MKIHINQAGYPCNAVKTAVINHKCREFFVRDSSGKPCLNGSTVHHGFDEVSGDDVHIADFSALTEPGRYTIFVDTEAEPMEFEISDKVYENVFRDMLRAFYYLRCGCELKEEHAGVYAHAVCHDKNSALWDDRSVQLDVSGGWHDAGDYGRYVTAASCALAHLLYAWKLFPKVYERLDMNIPESGSEVPDILAECRYELEWLLKMQRSDGGAYHKATTKDHAPFVMPEEDKARLYIFDVSSSATADLAAVCALASGIYREYDSEFSDRLYLAAEKAYGWLEENPGFRGFKNPAGNTTGEYGECSDHDNRFWASAEMFAASGEAKYHEEMKKALEEEFSLTALGYADTGGFGALAYILSGRIESDEELFAMFKAGFISEAERLAETAEKNGYGVSMVPHDFYWGSNMNLMKQGMIFAIADKLESGSRFSGNVQAQLDYLLGKNALGISYISGTGKRSINDPHLRPAYADGIEKCIPGMVSGGPNFRPSSHDLEFADFQPGEFPMKCFTDNYKCFSLNEITIYWNSAAVFSTAYILAGLRS